MIAQVMKSIMGALGRAFTSRDNWTPDIFRMLIFAAGSALIFVFIWTIVVMKSQPRYGDFAAAFATVLGSGGVSIWMKRKDEPEPRK